MGGQTSPANTPAGGKFGDTDQLIPLPGDTEVRRGRAHSGLTRQFGHRGEQAGGGEDE